MPLNGSSLPYVPTTAPVAQQIAALNRVIDIINGLQNSITFADDKSKRMFIGYQKDGWGPGKDFGIKISQVGVDVSTATDSQLLFKMDIESWVWYNNGIPQTLIGKAPDDGRNGVWATIPGQNVITQLGG